MATEKLGFTVYRPEENKELFCSQNIWKNAVDLILHLYQDIQKICVYINVCVCVALISWQTNIELTVCYGNHMK